MNRRLILIILVNLLFYHYSNAQFHQSEKRINKNKISKEIVHYVETNYTDKPVKYYKLRTDKDSIFYEAKVKSAQGKLNLVFNSKGQFIGLDNQIPYLEVPENSRIVMNNYLKENYSNYKVTHCRNRKIGNQKTYELDVSIKKKKYRFWFKNDGSFIDYREIHQKTIDLLFN